jgi:cysteine desulfurase
MTFSGHKIHVPAGIGFLYLNAGCQTKKARDDFGHEGGWRQGTENLLGIAALQLGIELMSISLSTDIQTMRSLREAFESSLKQALPNITINGSGERLPNVSNICFHGVDGESLLIALDRNGVAASHGSACTSGALEPSRVLAAMGMPTDAVRSSIRFSFSRMTTREEIDAAAAIIIDTVRKMST